MTSTQTIGEIIHNGPGQTAFSPSGEWYASYRAYGTTDDPYVKLYLYRFDRCTGDLSEPLSKDFPPDQDYWGGLAFSPNSRYLYVSKLNKIFQYDLEASDILASEQIVAEYDGFLGEFGIPIRFYRMILAPDNKIYVMVPGINTRYLHVIDQPDEPGMACNVLQHSIFLPCYNFGTVPNMPFFRLYAEAGSVCDTLNISTPAPLPPAGPALRVWPVPATDVLHFSVQDASAWPEALRLRLFDALGRFVLDVRDLRLEPTATVRLDPLPAGAYYYRLETGDGRVVKAGKVVRTK